MTHRDDVKDARETDPVAATQPPLRGRARPEASGPGSVIPAPVAVHRGILHCRAGEWHSGLYYLLRADGSDADLTLPGLYYSYLGQALARCEQRHAEAIALCERAVAIQFYEPENFLNLAWSRFLARDRRGAVMAIERGLALDPRHAGLRLLQQRIGRRRAPVVSFLPREHPVNRFFGRLRQRWQPASMAA